MKVEQYKLSTDEGLKRTLESVMGHVRTRKRQWYPALRAHLQRLQAARAEELSDRAFLEKLWEDDGISATGMGSVKMSPALDNPAFRAWFAAAFSAPLPADPGLLEAYLINLYKETESRLRVICGRTPRLKLNRVMCSLFPAFFTTIADVGRLLFLHSALGGSRRDHPVTAHLAIKRRFEDILGPIDLSEPDADLDRLFLPWFLHEHIFKQDEAAEKPDVEREDVTPAVADALRPQPAALRRKGLTAVKGYFGTLLEMLPLLDDGMSRQEFYDEVHRSFPELGPPSINGVINSVAREMNLCMVESGTYRLNPRGLNLLATQDPDEIADHLLTRVLGIDHAIKALDSGSLSMSELVQRVKVVNPGWTSEAIPRAIISWLSSLDVIAIDARRQCRLTERGALWASKIVWTPELLTLTPSGVTAALPAQPAMVQAPIFANVLVKLQQAGTAGYAFPPELVRELHGGLWSHPVRHFAVLTGISGSGKTQLALHYGNAITADQGTSERVLVVPVQPAWYDPAALLGYVSPLTQRYCSTPFLEFLLRAADDPEQPYVVVLDEMNLSHPEQYLAPLLSTMETGGWIDLHDLSEDTDEIPQRLRYPANLVLIGTLNMDETTHGLSDKILDRAYTLEFWQIDVENFPGWDKFQMPDALRKQSRQLLVDLGKALAPVRLHFAWRTVGDVMRYLERAVADNTNPIEALDAVVYARILPKLRGENTVRLHTALSTARTVLKKNELERCAAKLDSLLQDLAETGTARFWR